MGQVKRWGMAMEEAATEAVICGFSDEDQFEAVAKALKAEHWPVVDKEIERCLKEAREKTKDFREAFQAAVDK